LRAITKGDLLYALEAALRGLPWTALLPDVKTKLKAAAKAVKKRQ
jgi:hypothetical protein